MTGVSSDQYQHVLKASTYKSKDDFVIAVLPIIRDLTVERAIEKEIGDRQTTKNVLSASFCTVTSQVRIVERKEKNDTSSWVLQSIGPDGVKKLQGGDEYYIEYLEVLRPSENGNGCVTAVAVVTDLHDGDYRLNFYRSVAIDGCPGSSVDRSADSQNQRLGGQLIVYLEYTCGIGRMHPPSKKEWTGGGSPRARWTHNSTYLIPAPPLVEEFPIPAIMPQKSEIPSDGNATLSTEPIFLDNYDWVVYSGDSILEQMCFAGNRSVIPFPQTLRFHERTYFNDAKYPLNMNTVERIIAEIISALQGQMRTDDNRTHWNITRALVLGSAMWDLLGTNTMVRPDPDYFHTHFEAVHHLITRLRSDLVGKNVDIFWRLPTAIHLHVTPSDSENPMFGERIKYMSTSRNLMLYQQQVQIMTALEVPVLDLYLATHLSENWLVVGDGRHYRNKYMHFVMDWFFRKKTFPQM